MTREEFMKHAEAEMDREKVIKGIQECDLNGGLIGNCPYKDILFLLKEQDYRGWLMDMFHKYGRDDLIALLVLHGEENLLADVLKEQDAKDNNVPNKRAAGERAEAGAEDPEDNQGNNGPLKRIDPADVMDGLRRLAGSGVLGENWREILADAMTLLWLRYER